MLHKSLFLGTTINSPPLGQSEKCTILLLLLTLLYRSIDGTHTLIFANLLLCRNSNWSFESSKISKLFSPSLYISLYFCWSPALYPSQFIFCLPSSPFDWIWITFAVFLTNIDSIEHKSHWWSSLSVSTLQSKLNCEVLYDDLAFEVRWAVAGESIVIQLVAKLGKYLCTSSLYI